MSNASIDGSSNAQRHNDQHHDDHGRADNVMIGFWLFLMGDLIVFGLFFTTYVVMLDAKAGGPGPLELFNMTSVALQTLLLLASSMACGWAMLAAKYGHDTKQVIKWMLLSGLLALLFLVLEISDFAEMAHLGGTPMRSGYHSALWSLIGLHGLHVACGLIWLCVMVAQVRKFGCNELVMPRLWAWSLYWHFLDLMWIGIFSIVFLAGVA